MFYSHWLEYFQNCCPPEIVTISVSGFGIEWWQFYRGNPLFKQGETRMSKLIRADTKLIVTQISTLCHLNLHKSITPQTLMQITAAEVHSEIYSCQPRLGNWRYLGHRLTETGQLRTDNRLDKVNEDVKWSITYLCFCGLAGSDQIRTGCSVTSVWSGENFLMALIMHCYLISGFAKWTLTPSSGVYVFVYVSMWPCKYLFVCAHVCMCLCVHRDIFGYI